MRRERAVAAAALQSDLAAERDAERQRAIQLAAERREQLGARVEGIKAQLDVERLTWRGGSAHSRRPDGVDEDDDGTATFRDKIF